ncbi:MAG TPA: cytochrome P450 [Actinomycetota bacterium]|nr:cytochrome P450 [Actinomycetota bacterium]
MSDTAATTERPVRDPFRYLMGLARKHGPVAPYRAGTERAFLIDDADLVKHVLADHATNYSKGTFINETFKMVVADGLLTLEGADWRRERRLMQPAFHMERLNALGTSMTNATLAVLDRWDRIADSGEVVDVSAEMSQLTMTITARSLFGSDIAEDVEDVGHKISVGLAAFASPSKPEVIQARDGIVALVDKMIDARRRSGDGEHDLLTMLMEARDEDTGEPMSDLQLRNEVVTLILAGYETTANSLGWTWYLLSQNPDAAANVRAELAAVLGGREPQFRDLAALSVTRRALDESLRLYPPAWIMGRRALGDDRLGDVDIPAGSVLALSPYITHRNPAYWDDPERFDPERMRETKASLRKPFAYFPFGGGPRLCIGHNMAMLEAQLIIGTIAQRFDLRLVEGHTVVPERLFVLRPRGGLPMTLHRLPAAA